MEFREPSRQHSGYRSQKSKEQGEWVKLSDAAYALGVSEITLRRRIKNGRIPSELRNGKYRVFLEIDGATGEYLDPFDGNCEPPQINDQREYPDLTARNSPTLNRHIQRKDNLQNQTRERNQQFLFEQQDQGKKLSQTNLISTNHQADNMQKQLTQIRSLIQEQCSELAQLRRQLEDQQTLIALLEERVFGKF